MDLQDTNITEHLFSFLKEHQISYIRADHIPVFTVEESKKLNLGLEGGATKNLFLRDKKGKRHFLFCVEQSKQVDLKQLPKLVDSSNLSFASPDRLLKHLGILPGSVSLLALVNDEKGQVEVIVDEELWEEEHILCHPLTNTATLSIKKQALERFIKKTGHLFQLVEVPQQPIH